MSEQAYLVAKAARGEYRNSLLNAGNPDYQVQVRQGSHPYARQMGADAAGSTGGAVVGGALGAGAGYAGLRRREGKEATRRMAAGVANDLTNLSMGAQKKVNRGLGKLHRATGGRFGRPTMFRFGPGSGKALMGLATGTGLAGTIGGATVGGAVASRRSTDKSVKRGDLKVIRRSDKKRAIGMGYLEPKFKE
jgi:hypothetical protein